MKIKIDGLDCPNCAKALEKHINKLESVSNASLNFLKGYIEFDSKTPDKAITDIVNLTKQLEPDTKIILNNHKKGLNKNFIIDLAFLIVGISLGVCTLLINMPKWLWWCLFISSALMLGYKTYYKALRLLIKKTINENLLITISVIGATLVGEPFEALMVIALYSIGKILEGLAVNKSKKSIEALTHFKPEYAILLKDGQEIKVDPSKINIGDQVLVKPGEKIAIDGIITSGEASLDLQSLTGESLPVKVDQNSEVLSGSIVLDGVLTIKATKKYEESTASTILNLIETASENKSKTETFISKITKWYTLGVIICSVVVFAVIMLITKNLDLAIYRGLIFLVVSCPCAFAISVPLSYFSGLGNASKNGILIKGSNFLDALAKLNLIAFDKTGTITTGEFEITNIESYCSLSQEEILYIASLGEQYSLHPLAKAIINKNKKELIQVQNVKEIAGMGVHFTHNNKNYFVGRKNEQTNNTTVSIYDGDTLIGQIALADKIKHSSKHAIEFLKQQKIKTVMLSGDNKNIVETVANVVCVDSAISNLLPQDKYNYIKQAKQTQNVGYVGDGLNDAPSLTLANVGFCMGIKGNSASIDACDIVIANDNLEKIPQAIKMSKYTRKIVWQNIILSALIKITFLLLGAIGITGMLHAVIADVGVTVMAILNSLRALTHKTHTPHQHKNTCCPKN